MKTINRYLRIYGALLKINLAYLLAYRANFINNIIVAFGWGTFQVVWIVLLTGRRGTFFRWSQNDMILITFAYFMFMGIFHCVFSRNFDEFSRTIDRGELDGLLLKPLDSQFYATTRIVSYANMVRALVGFLLVIFWVSIKHYAITPLSFVLFGFYVGVGLMMLYAIWTICITVLIWYPNLSNIIDLLYTVNGLSRYPAEMVRQSGKLILLLLVPLMISISAPVRILINKNPLGDTAILTVVCITLFVISRKIWKSSLRSYTSAS